MTLIQFVARLTDEQIDILDGLDHVAINPESLATHINAVRAVREAQRELAKPAPRKRGRPTNAERKAKEAS
jgi:hypothetical protein